MSNPLSAIESKRLGELERVIARGLKSFMEVGTALMEIRDERFYRSTHGSFGDYCRERWDMSQDYAQKLISSVHVVNSLPTMVFKPDSERAARPLSQLHEKERAAAWFAAVEAADGGQPTAAQVQEAVNQHRAKINGDYGTEPGGDPIVHKPKERTATIPEATKTIVPDPAQSILVPNDPRLAALELRRYFATDRLRALIAYLKG